MRIDRREALLTIQEDWWLQGLSGLLNVMAGTAIAWYATSHIDLRHPGAAYVGFGLGLVWIGTGLSQLRPPPILDIDAVAQEVRETKHGWLGQRTRTLPFDHIDSIGTNISKDPRTNVEWEKIRVLRLKNGRTWVLASHDVVKAIADHTAWPICDQIVWCKETVAEYG